MALIRALRRVWKKIGPIERGERLRELAKRGCSTRGLGKELRQSATSIRRHMMLAGLPEADRNAVKAGASAKNILARKASADRRRRMQQRVATDARTGELSDRIADTTIAFCLTVDGVPETPIVEGDLSTFLNQVREALRDLQKHGAPRLRLSKKLSLKQRVKRTRPQPRGDEFWMEHQARRLATLVWSEAREEPIWDQSHSQESIGDWVFPSHITDRCYHASPIQQDYIRPAAEQLGLNGVGWHTFRHTYRAWLDATGAPIGVQQKLMRHAHPATTAIYGGGLLMSSKRDANSKVVRMVLPSAVRQESVA